MFSKLYLYLKIIRSDRLSISIVDLKINKKYKNVRILLLNLLKAVFVL